MQKCTVFVIENTFYFLASDAIPEARKRLNVSLFHLYSSPSNDINIKGKPGKVN